MTGVDWAQISGSGVAALVVLNQLVTLVRDWRGGSPELRMIQRQVDNQQEEWKTVWNDLKEGNKRLHDALSHLAESLDKLVGGD